jgi:hypothetical protein
MKSHTFHDVIKIARFANAPCIYWRCRFVILCSVSDWWVLSFDEIILTGGNRSTRGSIVHQRSHVDWSEIESGCTQWRRILQHIVLVALAEIQLLCFFLLSLTFIMCMRREVWQCIALLRFLMNLIQWHNSCLYGTVLSRYLLTLLSRERNRGSFRHVLLSD